MRSYEQLKNLASAIQSFALAVAVVIGGVWTAWTFYYLDESGIRKIENDLRKRELQTPAVVNMDIEVEQLTYPGMPQRFFAIDVILENVGSQRARFSVATATMRVYRIMDPGEQPKLLHEIPISNQIDTLVISPQERSVSTLASWAPDRGLYYFEASFTVTNVANAVGESTEEFSTDKPWLWKTAAFAVAQ